MVPLFWLQRRYMEEESKVAPETVSAAEESMPDTRKLSEKTLKECKGGKEKFKWIMNYIFIDGMSGMALGLFATLIAGTIIWQIGNLIDKATPNYFGLFLESLGKIAQISMGAGIGAGICLKMKKTAPLTVASSVAAGMIGSYAKNIITAMKASVANKSALSLVFAAPGDPMGAFIGAMTAMTLASLVSGKTKLDILVTPLVGLIGGGTVGVLLGYPVSLALTALGNFIAWAAGLSKISAAITGLIVAVVMGVCLTLPISSAAIGVSIGLSGVAAGAAVVGCCCQMVGFAVMSFRENKWGGLFAQGLGTSMLQIPNIFKKPVLFVPPIISSALLGTICTFLPNGTAVSGLLATKSGSGMGTAGLVGVIDMLFEMIGAQGCNPGLTVLWTLLFCIVLPAALTFGIYEIFRKAKVIEIGDLKLKL